MPKKHHFFFLGEVLVAGGLPQKMHRIVTTKRNTQQKQTLKFPEMSAVLNFSHVFFLMPHIPCLPPKNSWLTDLDTQFFEVKELIAEAEVQIQEAVFFSGVVVTRVSSEQLTPKNWLFLGMKKKSPVFFGGDFQLVKLYYPVIAGEIWGV